jgi:hypothetical protein
MSQMEDQENKEDEESSSEAEDLEAGAKML